MEDSTSLQSPVRFYRSPVVLLSQFVFLLSIYSIGVFVLYITRPLRPGAYLSSTASIVFVYKIGGTLIFLEMVRRYFNEMYIFGKSRIIHLQGRLSFNLRKVSISYRDIAEIRVEQSLWGRMFMFGTLQFSTPATDTREIVFSDIGFPESLSRRAELLISESQKLPSPHAIPSLE